MLRVSLVTMRIKEAIRLLGAIVFFFGSLQGVSQSAATRSQEVASHARQAKEFLKEQRPDLAIPEFRAIVALDPNIIKRLNKDSLAILGRARSTRSCSFQILNDTLLGLSPVAFLFVDRLWPRVASYS